MVIIIPVSVYPGVPDDLEGTKRYVSGTQTIPGGAELVQTPSDVLPTGFLFGRSSPRIRKLCRHMCGGGHEQMRATTVRAYEVPTTAPSPKEYWVKAGVL